MVRLASSATTRRSSSLARLTGESLSLIVVSLGSNETGLEALLSHFSGIIEPEETPHANGVALDEFSEGHLGEDEIPDEWLEESLIGSFDEWEHLMISFMLKIIKFMHSSLLNQVFLPIQFYFRNNI